MSKNDRQNASRATRPPYPTLPDLPNIRHITIPEILTSFSLLSAFVLGTQVYTASDVALDKQTRNVVSIWLFNYILWIGLYFAHPARYKPTWSWMSLILGVMAGLIHGVAFKSENLVRTGLVYVPGWLLGSLVFGAQIAEWFGPAASGTDGQTISVTKHT